MPHWHGDRELDVFLRHRARLPVDATPVVATMELPFAIGLNLAAVGGDLPVDGSIGARTAALTRALRRRRRHGHRLHLRR